ncbi:MAG: response regulator transcription factor [Gammaproteobacteria bacterium]|nr:response regulator transcription factor [Gammaproteobacteria bacterium]
MNKLHTIIVDDEALALSLLRSCLDELANIEIVAECCNGRQAIEAALTHQPDLMFLDIQMPGLNGFDVIRNLQADVMPLVIFVTAYDQFAVDAFDVHAVDYILKPLDAENVARAIERCETRLAQQSVAGAESNGFKPGFISAMADIPRQSASSVPESPMAEEPAADQNAVQSQKILVKDGGAITLIDQEEIEWIDAAGDYMCIHANGVTHIMRSTLKGLLAQLDPGIFKRVHRSTIVNLRCIHKVIPHTKGECFLELDQNERIKVSRNYRSVIQGYLSDVQG